MTIDSPDEQGLETANITRAAAVGHNQAADLVMISVSASAIRRIPLTT
jgi:hypothetical protein